MSLEVGCFFLCVRGREQSWSISRLKIDGEYVWLYHDNISTGTSGWLHNQCTSVGAVSWRVYHNNRSVRHEDAQDAAVHICMVSDSMKKTCHWLHLFCNLFVGSWWIISTDVSGSIMFYPCQCWWTILVDDTGYPLATSPPLLIKIFVTISNWAGGAPPLGAPRALRTNWSPGLGLRGRELQGSFWKTMEVLKLKLLKTEDYNLIHWLEMGNPYFLLQNPSKCGGFSLIGKRVLGDMSNLFLAVLNCWAWLYSHTGMVWSSSPEYDKHCSQATLWVVKPPNLKRVLECSVPLVCGLFKCTTILRCEFAQNRDN